MDEVIPRKQSGDAAWIRRATWLAWMALNAVVLLNACLHDPTVGYDAPSHVRYAEVLSTLHWPRPPEVYEFFSPPLPYVFPAVLIGTLGTSSWWAVKCAQLLNVLLSIILTRALVRLCTFMRGGDPRLALASMLLLAVVPAYYRTFAFFRGEPYVATFGMLAACETLKMTRAMPTIGGTLRLGCFLGLAGLSRQWAFGLWGGVAIFLLLQAPGRLEYRARSLAALGGSLLIAALIAGGFYLHQARTYGSPIPFNRRAASEFGLTNQPHAFYVGIDSHVLFRDPIRPSSPNRLLSIFYADLWGDYWAYFLVYAFDVRQGRYLFGADFEAATTAKPLPETIETNRFSIAAYLGRNDLLGLLPSALFLVGILAGLLELRTVLARRPRRENAGGGLLAACLVLSSLGLFLWFVIMYPEPKEGDTVKVSYMLQCLPFLALLAGDVLARLGRSSRFAYWLGIIGLGAIFAHNLPAAITRYPAR